MLYLLRASILALASFVVWASVVGLGSLFSTIAIPVMLAGAALDGGKYVAISFAYQHWQALSRVERVLATLFIAITMVFTSAGVFSYLGQNFQVSYIAAATASSTFTETTVQLTSVQKRLAEIESQITSVPTTTSVGARIRMIRVYEEERKVLLGQQSVLGAQLDVLRGKDSEARVHAGPITYLARVFSTTVENAATVVISALTLCLDPFALFLTVLMNKMVVLRRTAIRAVNTLEPTETKPEPKPPAPIPASEPTAWSVTTTEPPATQRRPQRRVWNPRTKSVSRTRRPVVVEPETNPYTGKPYKSAAAYAADAAAVTARLTHAPVTARVVVHDSAPNTLF